MAEEEPEEKQKKGRRKDHGELEAGGDLPPEGSGDEESVAGDDDDAVDISFCQQPTQLSQPSSRTSTPKESGGSNKENSTRRKNQAEMSSATQ